MITDPLLFRFLDGQTTGPENRKIEQWLNAHPGHRKRLDSLRDLQDQSANPDSGILPDEAWLEFESRITPPPAVSESRKPVRIPVALMAAATLLILVSSGLFMLMRYNNRIIRNNELITKSFFLTDGTQVYLGPTSRLITGKNFGKNMREVRLIGQAFFDVTPDPLHPFMVNAGEAKIEVTGTRFAITAPRKYGEVEVSVKSGQVLFYNSHIIRRKAFRMGLGPGEMGIFSPTLNRMDKTRDPYFLTSP